MYMHVHALIHATYVLVLQTSSLPPVWLPVESKELCVIMARQLYSLIVPNVCRVYAHFIIHACTCSRLHVHPSLVPRRSERG